jgi:hypothetical protein
VREKTFVYDIIEREVMGDNQGITFPDRKLMPITFIFARMPGMLCYSLACR